MAETPDITVEQALAELREIFGPYPQIIVSIRDCGRETQTPRKTTLEYSAQIGMNGEDFIGDTLTDCLGQVRHLEEKHQ